MKGSVMNKPNKVMLIIGKARQVFLAANKKDQVHKHLYSYSGDLYSGWSYQGARCITTFHGKYVGDSTIYVYGEGCIHPHIETTWDYDARLRLGNNASRFQATIKEERAGNVKNPKKTAGILTKINPRKNWPMILVGVVLVVALITSGGKI